MEDIEKLCAARGLKMTGQRRVIARVLTESDDHPDVEQLHRRAAAIDAGISIATVYRTVRLFEEANILERHEFRDGRARYEQVGDHHDHLIDVETGDTLIFDGRTPHGPERIVRSPAKYISLLTSKRENGD